MNILLFFIANFIVLASAIIMAKRIKLNSLSDRTLAIFVLFISQIILTEMFLGIVVRRLFYLELLITNIIVLLIVIIINRKILKPSKFNYKPKNLSHIIKSPLLIALSLIALTLVCYIIYIGYNFPPRGIDELMYHLPQVGFWLQDGQISMLNLNCTNQNWSWGNVYPINTELLALWNIIFLKVDWIVDLVQLPFALIGVIAIYSMTRKLSISVKNSLIAGIMFLLTPIVVIQSSVVYVDVAFGVMVLITLNFLMGYYINKNREYMFLTALAAGIMLGIKSSGIAYCAIIVFIVFLLFIIKSRKDLNLRKLLKTTLLILIPVILLGGFIYIRNLVTYYNPIYPFGMKVMGIEVFNKAGDIEKMIMEPNVPNEYKNSPNYVNVINTWFENTRYYSYDERMGGFGPLWIIIQLPAIIFLLYITARKKNKPALALIVLFIVLFLIQPSNWWTRYTIFIIGLGCIASGYILDYLSTFSRTIISIIIIMLSMFTAITVIPFLHVPMPSFTLKLEDAMKKPIEERTTGKLYYSDCVWTDNLPEDSKIGVLSREFIYSFFGTTFKNKIHILDIDASEEAIIREVSDNNLAYVTVGKTDLSLCNIFDKDKNNFTIFFEGNNIKVYKVIGKRG